MGTRIKPVIPLEIGKRNRKTWKTSPSQCVAILGESDEIKEKACPLSIRKDFAQSAQPRVQAFASEESWREHELGE